MLKCPHCKSENKGKIVDSEYIFLKRLQFNTVRRRRVCLVCKKRWTTVEINREEVIKLEKAKK